MKRGGGILALALAATSGAAHAQRATVAVYGNVQPAVLTQRNGVAASADSEFTLYQLNAFKGVPPAPETAESLPETVAPLDGLTRASTAVMPEMAQAFGALARPSPAVVPALASSLAGCSGLAAAPVKLSISAQTHMLRRTWYPVVRAAECRYGLPAGLLDSVVIQESRYKIMAVSPKGASGLSQLMPGTALDLGVRNIFEPAGNVDGGARYLRQLLNTFKSIPIALAAYNAGPGAVRRAGGIPRNGETPGYVRNVLSYWTDGATDTRIAGIATGAEVSPARRMAVLLGF